MNGDESEDPSIAYAEDVWAYTEMVRKDCEARGIPNPYDQPQPEGEFNWATGEFEPVEEEDEDE